MRSGERVVSEGCNNKRLTKVSPHLSFVTCTTTIIATIKSLMRIFSFCFFYGIETIAKNTYICPVLDGRQKTATSRMYFVIAVIVSVVIKIIGLHVLTTFPLHKCKHMFMQTYSIILEEAVK